MRLSIDQIKAIRYAASTTFGDDTQVWLFGSRVDDAKKGGDIDLLVRPSPTAEQNFAQKVSMLALLEKLLGERKIDLVIEHPSDNRPIRYTRLQDDMGARLMPAVLKVLGEDVAHDYPDSPAERFDRRQAATQAAQKLLKAMAQFEPKIMQITLQ